jgi:hypothetical protein
MFSPSNPGIDGRGKKINCSIIEGFPMGTRKESTTHIVLRRKQ